MPKQAALSMRPGTILGYRGEAYKVIKNNTLDQVFTMELIENPRITKRIRYRAGDVLDVRWVPFSNNS